MTQDTMILVGISCRTTNATEASAQAKIPGMFERYFAQGIFSQIQNQTNPGILYSCYADYSSDHSGEYTYFLGQEVSSIDTVPDGLDVLEVPAQSYHVVSEAGPMPQACIDAWQKIWADSDLESRRSYLVDFERYDLSKMNPEHTEFQICVGLK